MRYPLALMLLATPALVQAQERAAGQAPGLGKPPVAAPAAKSAVRILSGCWTNQAGCAGAAHFQAPGNSAVSCTVWFGNGAQGQSNFVMPAGQGHDIHVRTGDTQSCAYGNSGVPAGTTRYYIWVS